ncbi:MAG TPA: efflux RND transporter periplasmic adaptor subunit [Verrucomicrobiae bacterium]
MKRFLYLGIVVGLIAAAYWAGSRSGRQSLAAGSSLGARRILYYVDPMNPAHTSDKPGKAPCGMDMEPVYADSLAALPVTAVPTAGSAGLIKVSPEKQQLIGVRVALAEKKRLTHTSRLLGKVATDETRIYRINATVDGWITKTLPFSAGSQVKKDETLAQFYSPEFLAAAQALVYALGSADRVATTGQETDVQRSQIANFNLNIKQYRDGLRNLGMGEFQIDEVARTRVRPENVNITSPTDGFILVRNVSDGQRFDKGTELFRIADLSRVWILVDVFEKDASVVEPDRPVSVSLPSQGKTFTAAVSKTLPQFDNATRTLKLRLEADNPEFTLKPDMFVDVELPLSLPEQLVVPADAVVDAGLRQTVYVDCGNGYFEARDVQLGSRVGDQVQVVHGLKPEERIVTSGNFLLDSESRMKLAAAGMLAAPSTDPVCGMAVDESAARAAKRSSDYQGKTYYFCSDGCKKKFDADPAKGLARVKMRPTSAAVTAPARAVDPVCKMKVDPAEAEAEKLTADHQGTTYYFCNAACKKKFQNGPATYLASGELKAAEMPGAMKTDETGPAHSR